MESIRIDADLMTNDPNDIDKFLMQHDSNDEARVVYPELDGLCIDQNLQENDMIYRLHNRKGLIVYYLRRVDKLMSLANIIISIEYVTVDMSDSLLDSNCIRLFLDPLIHAKVLSFISLLIYRLNTLLQSTIQNIKQKELIDTVPRIQYDLRYRYEPEIKTSNDATSEFKVHNPYNIYNRRSICTTRSNIRTQSQLHKANVEIEIEGIKKRETKQAFEIMITFKGMVLLPRGNIPKEKITFLGCK